MERLAGAATVLLTLALGSSALAAPVRIGKLKYGGGGDWYSNRSSLPNLIAALRQRTAMDIANEPGTVTPLDRELYSHSYIFATGHGRIRFTEDEAAALRRYLLRGGFLHVDDNYGMDPHFRKAVQVLFPDRELVELPFDHPIYHCFYDFATGLPKIHEHHGGPPHGYAILDKGRVVLFYSYNTDLGDGWESPEVHSNPPEKREAALRMGVNILVYALTH
ncbi:MAG: DUF4159 domain-containing protein [Armatimonadota bacterium]|jgi:hypothetical protein